jgi:hypothetical protein
MIYIFLNLGLLSLETDPLKRLLMATKELLLFLIIATAPTWNFHQTALHHTTCISIWSHFIHFLMVLKKAFHGA